jgi:hypothetical protein
LYNAIACFVISALATFCACFFGGAILKRNNHSINEEKTFIYLLMQHARLDGVATNFI